MGEHKLKLESAIYESSGKHYIGGKVVEEVLKDYHLEQIKHFLEWIEDNHSITIHDMIVEDYIKNQ
jgi:hypothetical protein